MKSIYQQAKRTVIWLPLGDETAVAAKSLIDELSHLSETYKETYKETIKLEQDSVVQNMAKKEAYNQSYSLMPAQDDARWRALGIFLRLPWFSRVWILQEVALSRRSPTILCGPQLIEWKHLEYATEWIRDMFETGFWMPIGYILDIVVICRKREWADGTYGVSWDLHGLLHFTIDFYATEPRDRIFALLGLCRETRDATHWPPELNPDYAKPLVDFSIEIARYLIREKESTSILGLSSGVRQDGGYPSWVPRWDEPPQPFTTYGHRGVFEESHWSDVKDPFNNASFGRIPFIDETTPTTTLRLRGIRISSAKLCCNTIEWEDTWDQSSGVAALRTDLQPKFRMMLDACKEALPHLSTAELHRAFFVVTNLGETSDGEDALSEPLIHFESYMGISSAATKDIIQTDSHDSLEPSGSTSLPNPPTEPDPVRYASQLAYLTNHRVFVTSSGHLGLGPEYMELNDVVVVLFGGNLPFLLRPLTNGQWNLVGQCYVHGIMKGEALTGEGANEDNHEWFELV
jgi:hypothetical protein